MLAFFDTIIPPLSLDGHLQELARVRGPDQGLLGRALQVVRDAVRGASLRGRQRRARRSLPPPLAPSPRRASGPSSRRRARRPPRPSWRRCLPARSWSTPTVVAPATWATRPPAGARSRCRSSRPARSRATIVFSNVADSGLDAIAVTSASWGAMPASSAGFSASRSSRWNAGTPPNGPVQSVSSGLLTSTTERLVTALNQDRRRPRASHRGWRPPLQVSSGCSSPGASR